MDKQEFLLHAKPQVNKRDAPQTTGDSPIVAAMLRYAGVIVVALGAIALMVQHLST
ncbi:hypothetical protein [Paraburkholderia youngii]|uniref:Uncharacterized protein n=1 Tax=Paraburkholderia youngii TaxID=2782701 RepID=A0A7W8L9R0_9BURK|nr:hypothetical protein [Paraburkholderia youngii]MBB5402633.1 hypothetical protein [Paraburkholderia youngii]